MATSPPLPVEAIDLESLVLARNDGHPDGDWWFDPRSGECLYLGVDDDTDLPALSEGSHVLVPHDPQPPSDVEEFIEGLDDEAEAARLYAAFHRRGGRKRFLELVAAGPYAEAWRAWTLRREAVRAIDWLLDRGLVDPGSAVAHRTALQAEGR